VELAARFRTEADAGRARERVQLLVSVLAHAAGPFATLAKGAATSAIGASAVVRVHLDAKAFAELVGADVKGAS
jgi:hypothetical protein